MVGIMVGKNDVNDISSYSRSCCCLQDSRVVAVAVAVATTVAILLVVIVVAI